MNSKWALVLGVSSGAGAAIARALAEDPALNIVGFHRGNYQRAADEIKSTVESKGRQCCLYVADAGKGETIPELAQLIKRDLGQHQISFFVHSIANGSFGRFVSGEKDQLHPKQFSKTMDSMANSFVYWTQAMLVHELLAPGARLLGLTNPIVDSSVNGLGLISASKAALETYIRYLAMELGPRGYRVNLLKFGLVETPAIRMAFSEGEWEKLKSRVASATPSRRLITVDEVARLVSFLASDRADGFNGATIDFSGGQSQSMQDLIYNPRESGQLLNTKKD